MLSLLLGATLTACGNNTQRLVIPVQHWKQMNVSLDTHPNPPLAGMSEVVVIVTGPHGKPIQDLTVSLRSNDAMPWVQAIQDGYIGVYRRALDIGEGDKTRVQVRLDQGAEQKILLYSLKLSPG